MRPSLAYSVAFLGSTVVAKPLVARDTCGVAGYDKAKPEAYDYLTGSKYSSAAKCGTYCASQSKCKSYAFGNSACLVYSAAV